MPNVLDFVTLHFDNERSWRNALAEIVRFHPHAPLDAAGDLEILVPETLANWAEAKLAGAKINRVEKEAEWASADSHGPSEPLYRDPKRLADWIAEVEHEDKVLQERLQTS